MSCHGTRAWDENYVWDSKVVGVMFAGRSQEEEDIVYLGINAFWKPQQIELPALPANRYWIPVVDTAREEETVIGQEEILDRNVYVMGARSVLICVVKRK